MKRQGRLFRKFSILIVGLVGGVLLLSAGIEGYFSFQENKSSLGRIQKEKALAAAAVISRFMAEIENQIALTTQSSFLPPAEALQQRRIDFLRLLRQSPVITEISLLDIAGKEQIHVSRLTIDSVGSGEDFSNAAHFKKAKPKSLHVSPVYFRKQSEPYATVSMAGRRKPATVTVAQINLKFIRDVISEIKVGRAGRAFVIDSRNLLIAHPDISLVLRKTDFSQLPQVASARAQSSKIDTNSPGEITLDLGGERVLSAHAAIPNVNWLVFVELPLSEAFEPLYDSLVRTGILLLIGIAFSVLAGILLAQRIVTPIRALHSGAARIGDGALEQKIDVDTGDELEDLADQFNQMGERLLDSYANVERMSQLKQYFSPQLAEQIISSEGKDLTESHRQDITVIFCDLRNFTAFSSNAEPEDAMGVLRDYYKILGALLRKYEATINYFAGDGLMAFFNDPVPCPDPAERAVRMAVAMREEMATTIVEWRKRGIDLGFGIGITSGYATLGHIGSEEQFHYTCIGSVANLASRLCDQAQHGQILISERILADIGEFADVERMEDGVLKGFNKPVPMYDVVGIKSMA
ncbi:MAG: adenylate/guanylate cyclase domain-containing protein [Rhodospirillaceae bacterium]|nr:adenylate/guanylate cyclase domain-containing protein [Rhodospirillaceae bacterium]